MTNENIGAYVASLRKANNWRLHDLRARTTLSVSYLSDIEQGRSAPTVDTLELIAAAFEMTLADFFGGAQTEFTEREHDLILHFRSRNFAALLKMIALELEQTA